MSVQRWAMIRNNVVENVCLWDGLMTTWQPPAGVEMQPAPDHVAIGWQYNDGAWTAPVVEEPPNETPLATE